MTGTTSSASSPSGMIGPARPLQSKALLRALRQELGSKKRRSLTALYQTVTSQKLIYHPLWLGKVLTLAARPPFPPKKTPNLVFVDAVSGYRGVLERIPTLEEGTPDDGQYVQPVIDLNEVARQYVQSVLHTINRGYVLKKPEHQLASLELVLLPLWQISLDLDTPQRVYLNGVTGESESYMANLWNSNSWLTLDSGALAPLKPSPR